MALLKAKTSVLLALLEGAAPGSALARRAPGGRIAPGVLYPALRDLERQRLARSWPVTPGRRRGGRTRICYELTPRGLAQATADRATLRSLLASPAPPRQAVGRGMRARLRRCAEVSAMALRLQARARAAGR